MRRPLSVAIIGGVILAQGLVFLTLASLTLGSAWQAGGLLASPPPAQVAPAPTPQAAGGRWLPPAIFPGVGPDAGRGRRQELLAAAAMVMGICGLVSSAGILRVRPWAWLMAMIAQGINLATELASYSRGSAIYLNMLSSVMIVLYLNQRDIQRAFSAALRRADPLGARVADSSQAATAETQREAT